MFQHEEMVLLLIQLRRSQSRLEDARNWYRTQMEFSRIGEKEYKRQYVIFNIHIVFQKNCIFSVCLLRLGINFFFFFFFATTKCRPMCFCTINTVFGDFGIINTVCIRSLVHCRRSTSIGRLEDALEDEHEQYVSLRKNTSKLDKQLDVHKPLVNLLDNLVTMGSLYGGDNLMLTSQYKKVGHN